MTTSSAQLVAELEARATRLGFDHFGVARADARADLPEKLQTALAKGWHGDMEWLAERSEARASPRALWPEVKSVILLGFNYAPKDDPLALVAQKTTGNISAYARNRDYHDVIKGKLKEVAGLLARRAEARVKVFVDTAPVMEKPLAEAAGLGWQGKHTVLVSRRAGSWLFLGAIFTDAELPPNQAHAQSCGSCRRCLDICPTKAFPAPFQLDARKCIAYLTVEAKHQIPKALRAPMGNRIFGCDDCLAVCPWNKFAAHTREIKLQARQELRAPPLAELAQLEDAGFRALFAGSPVKRLGFARFLRNVLIAIGNSGDPGLALLAKNRLTHADPLVRGAAIWAFRRLGGLEEVNSARARHLPDERDPTVATEWDGAL